MKALRRRAKLLTAKLFALRSELETSKQIIDIAKAELQNLYRESSKEKEHSNLNPTSPEPAPLTNAAGPVPSFITEESPTAEKLADPEVKKMFKKVASVCHPDKLQDLEQDANKKRLESLYQQARQALDENDFFGLFSIYEQLGMDLPDLSPQQIILIQNKINTIKKELNHIESSIAWGWYFEEDKDKKHKIQEKIFELLDEKNRRNTGP